MKNVELSSPTLFDPILNQAKSYAEKSKEEGSKTYQILLILTDGEIHDMEKVVNTLI